MESSYFVILLILLGSMAALVPVFMCLFFHGRIGIYFLYGLAVARSCAEPVSKYG